MVAPPPVTLVLSVEGLILEDRSDAGALLDRADGLMRGQDGRLTTVSEVARPALDEAISAMASTPTGPQPAALVPVPRATAPGLLALYHTGPCDADRVPRTITGVLRAARPSSFHRVRRLCEAFRLTLPEARLVDALLAGVTPGDFGSLEGLSDRAILYLLTRAKVRVGGPTQGALLARCCRRLQLVRPKSNRPPGPMPGAGNPPASEDMARIGTGPGHLCLPYRAEV